MLGVGQLSGIWVGWTDRWPFWVVRMGKIANLKISDFKRLVRCDSEGVEAKEPGQAEGTFP